MKKICRNQYAQLNRLRRDVDFIVRMGWKLYSCRTLIWKWLSRTFVLSATQKKLSMEICYGNEKLVEGGGKAAKLVKEAAV